jgi:ABC-type transport system involved in multi-copper enzyme maturation permease subunit
MSTSRWGHLVAKEARSLATLWGAAALALGAAAFLGSPVWPAGLVIFAIGASALGAWTVGQEYLQHTLPALLTQPVARRRVFAVKLVVLSVAIAALAAIAWLAVRSPGVLGGTVAVADHPTDDMAIAAAAFSAVLVAPALTMLCRSAVGGAVFTLALPLALALLGLLLPHPGAPQTGIVTPELEAADLTVLTWGLVVAWMVLGPWSWRMFRRLEAVDGPPAAVASWAPARQADREARRGRRTAHGQARVTWLLIRKELHLQQMTLAVSGLFVLAWLGLMLHRALTPEQPHPLVPAVVLLHGMLVPLLVGAQASAGEREVGALEWQLLLPVSRARQWTIKVGSAIGLAVLLNLGLPMLLAVIHPTPDDLLYSHWLLAAVVLLTVIAIFTSSLASSVLAALLVSIPVALSLLAGAVGLSALFVRLHLYAPAVPLARLLWSRGSDGLVSAIGLGGLLACLTAFAAVVMRLAKQNHESPLRGRDRLPRQVGWIGAALAAAVFTVTALGPFATVWWINQHVGSIRTR